MKILLVAPQPFYQERGTPMAVRLLAATLCEFGHEVDLLCYHVGANVSLPGLRVIRAWRPPGVGDVPIGISWQKIVCDVSLVVRMLALLARQRYDVIHAVEEAIFPAALFSAFSRRKLVYDMDSSLSDQLTDKWRRLKPLHGFFQSFERLAVRRSTAVFAVCEDLAVKVRPWIDERCVFVLPDVPIPDVVPVEAVESLRPRTAPAELSITEQTYGIYVNDTFTSMKAANAVIALYVGNLERYQGIDLLLEGVARVSPETNLQTIVIGGDITRVKLYRQRAFDLGIATRVRFIGARPVAHLNAYLAQADILVSPRILGQNTPMKVYSYMQSGKAILATDIRSHSQVLNSECAELVAPDPAALAAGLERLAADPELRRRLGAVALETAMREYSLPVFRRKLQEAYTTIASA
jgi:glycosyltransferase involved in cell wall biosynthesis